MMLVDRLRDSISTSGRRSSGGLFTPLILALAVIASALAVIRVKHENRMLTSEIEKQRVERERLDMEWSQLQLEEAALSHHARIERMARDNLQMSEPREYVIVQQ
jgi:cell division protein FtsL